MVTNKTQPTAASVADYIASRANDQQRDDCNALMTMFERITGEPPKMWGPSIVGFGSYQYRYESGRSGEAPLAATTCACRPISPGATGRGLDYRRAGKIRMTQSSARVIL